MTSKPQVVDGGLIPNRGNWLLSLTILRDDEAVDLEDKTVTATVRREDAPTVVIHSSLEDHACTVPAETADEGFATLLLTAAELARLEAPTKVTETYSYLVHTKVVEDDYFPDPVRVRVHGVLD